MFVKSNDVILDFCLTLWVSESQKFFATTTFGRHVERLEIVFMAVCGMLFNTRWAPCRRLQSRVMAKGKIPRKLGAM